MFYSSIHEIWENLIQTYSMKKDFTACYDIESKIFNSRQGTLSMCKANSIGYTRLVKRGRIFKFLHGLNFKYDLIRVQILSKEKLPSLKLQHKICNGDKKGPLKRSTSEGKPFTKSSHGEYCTYCKQLGHTKDTCYKCYEKEKVLERMNGNKGSTQMWNVVEHPSTSQLDHDIQAFSKEEMDRLRALLNSTSKPLGSCGLIKNDKSSFNIFNHMTPFPSYFTSYVKVSKKQLIIVANVDHVPTVGPDNIQLHSSLSLHNELTTGRIIGVAKEQGKLYYLQHTKIGNNTNKEELPSKTWAASQIWLYHKRLGYPLFELLKAMFPHLFTKESVESLSVIFASFQSTIVQHFLLVIIKVLNLLTSFILICGGQLVTLYQGTKWFVSLWSDNDTEFVNLEFSNFLKDNGVVHELTCVNTPQQNGVAERKNHHLLEVARALIFQMSVPNVYWGEVVLTATYLINRLPTQVLNGISPIKHMLSFFPSSPL
ncbi:hypothetical protein CR513_34043, partial [Mucuna pruriens]